MGSGVLTGILVQAGLLEGLQVLFADKKGLAIRNGGVFGHVIYSKKEKSFSRTFTGTLKCSIILLLPQCLSYAPTIYT